MSHLRYQLKIIVARRIDTLLMFSTNDLDFIDKIQKVFQVVESNKIKVQSWFGLLFNEYCIDKDELIGKFVKCEKLDLLEEIVLYFVRNKLKTHVLREYVYSISNYDIEFLRNITDLLIDYKLHLDYDLLSVLWYADDSFNKADIIFDEAVKQKELFLTPLFLEHAFLNFDDNGKMFLQWAQNKVKRISKDNEYRLLFELVSRCSCEKAINI